MAIQWTEALSTGVETIDEQHKELIVRVNNLLEACQQGKGKLIMAGLLNFLADYAVRHFAEEEKYMQTYDYPGYEAHKAQHEKFISDFGLLKNKFDAQGAGVNLVLVTNRTIVDWLVNHINNTDKALGAFLKERIQR
jgi:hemerythrin